MIPVGDWLLKLSDPKGVRPRLRMPGDTPELIEQLHLLSRAGLLPPNTVGCWAMPCPRCGRMTGVTYEQQRDCWPPVSVCGRCRSEWIREHPDWIAKWKGWGE